MRILALEPYYGGSHRAFLDGWHTHSRHRFTILHLPARKWKWRMRHAALTLRDQVAALLASRPDGTALQAEGCAGEDTGGPAGDPRSPDDGRRGERPRPGGAGIPPAGGRREGRPLRAGGPCFPASWDVLFCSDMLNLAEFIGLAPPAVQRLPRIAYFHENQLTYPFRHETERDFHFGFTNMTTAAAATEVWFNSAFHRDSFLDALRDVLKRMPDYQPLDIIDHIRAKSHIHPPGIDPIPPRAPRGFAPRPPAPEARPREPLRILWGARWEHDKNPDDFFAALYSVRDAGVPFRLSVIGEQFRDWPLAFDEASELLQDCIDRWGHQPTRADYVAALHEADVFVSTANHEFFGISVIEAMAAGCHPLLPRRLSYPELVGLGVEPGREAFFYDGTVRGLARRLCELAVRQERTGSVWAGDERAGARIAEQFVWPRLAPDVDAAIERLRPAK